MRFAKSPKPYFLLYELPSPHRGLTNAQGISRVAPRDLLRYCIQNDLSARSNSANGNLIKGRSTARNFIHARDGSG